MNVTVNAEADTVVVFMHPFRRTEIQKFAGRSLATRAHTIVLVIDFRGADNQFVTEALDVVFVLANSAVLEEVRLPFPFGARSAMPVLESV